jgi:hypothetical protein
MTVGDDLFWGFDDFPQLELRLAGRDPLDPVTVRPWDEPRSSAARTRRP